MFFMNEQRNDSSDVKVTKRVQTINGIDQSLYNKVVAKVGHPKRGKLQINTNLAMKLRIAGFSYKQVGKYMGVSGCTVKRRLREAGLI